MRTSRWVAVLAAAGLVMVLLAACGSDDGGDTGTSGSAETSEASGSKPKIAWLNALTSNTYLTSTSAALDRVAKENGAEITEFDAGYDIAKQQQELQNVIASNQYDGIIIFPIGPEVGVDVTTAAEAGLKNVVVGATLGPDLNTPDPQVEGVEFSVLSPPQAQGVGLGELAVEACKGKNPCRVVYFYGIKGTPSDGAYRDGFEEAIAKGDGIEIVADAEGKYEGPDVALAAMQNVLQSTPEFDVVVGIDQSMQGVQLALEQADKMDGVSIIGLGGSDAALAAIADGKWYGGVMTAPATEGEVAMEAMLELLEGKTPNPDGVNPVTEFPNEGKITKENIDQFEPQWTG